jgi:hypothetical protein
MKIKNSKLSILSVSAVLTMTVLASSVSYAGFQENHSVQVTPVEIQPQPVTTQPKKALQIFDDRYVPENIQKKYNLSDDWFDKSQQKNVMPTQLLPNTLEIRSAKPLSDAIVTGTWRASKGEPLRSVLQRWSERSQIDLMWASPESPILKENFSFVGKYQDAVNKLIKTEGGDAIHSQYRSEGLEPVMMAPASTITTNTPPVEKQESPQEIKPVPNAFSRIFTPTKDENQKPETRWFALSGAPLAEVIKVWAEDAGVTLIWQSEKNFALQKSISQVGHFEDAVFKALSQFDNHPIRPVGEIFNDPDKGLVLIVKTEVN